MSKQKNELIAGLEKMYGKGGFTLEFFSKAQAAARGNDSGKGWYIHRFGLNGWSYIGADLEQAGVWVETKETV